MISDVLFDAVEGMRHYLDDPTFAEVYKTLRPQLEKLTADMEAMRTLLDRMPGTPVN